MDTLQLLLTNPLPHSRDELSGITTVLIISIVALIGMQFVPNPSDDWLQMRTIVWWSVLVYLALQLGYWTFYALTDNPSVNGTERDSQVFMAPVLAYGLYLYFFLHWIYGAIENSQWLFRRRVRKAVRDIDRLGMTAHRDLDELDREARQLLQQELSKARRNGGSK